MNVAPLGWSVSHGCSPGSLDKQIGHRYPLSGKSLSYQAVPCAMSEPLKNAPDFCALAGLGSEL